jgi:hypothetical protein
MLSLRLRTSTVTPIDVGLKLLVRGHTKETGNCNATAISENCYQTKLIMWN